MSRYSITAVLLALTASGCAVPRAPVTKLHLTATAVEVPGPHDEPRQILIEVEVHGTEDITLPKIITLDGYPASMFVGKTTPGGHAVSEGITVNAIARGATATLDAQQVLGGVVIATGELQIPITARR